MAEFVVIPVERLQESVLQALLEEFATRDGTDYGQREVSLEHKVDELRAQLGRGDLQLVYDTESETWDLLPAERAALLLGE
ncbi:MAG: YheU family protein [Halieaceae bacterium]|nr:YheU family protein [Halieaceae bacterium]